MNYKILPFALIAAILLILVIVVALPRSQQGNRAGSEVKPNLLPQVALPTSTPLSSNAFSSSNASSGVQPPIGSENVPPASPPSPQNPVFQGKSVTSLSDVARIIASATSSGNAPASAPAGTAAASTASSAASPIAASAQLLALPDVPDSEIEIDPSGAATASDYLKYFNAHFADVSFDAKQFDGVLKNASGTILFMNDLVEKAIADGNFPEIHSSLLVQRDFADAEIGFMRSIKVTGAAIALNKQAIGFEELTIDLVNNALAVEAGTFSKNNFLAYYARFAATAQSAHQELVAQSGALSTATDNGNWLTKILQWFGIKALAQSANPPFGGMVVMVLPCPCNFGIWVIVGTPVPASLFVPVAFMASPLFFPFKAAHPGAWWLGLYNPLVQIPCLVPPLCTPAGSGGEIIMAGTSE